MRQLENTYPQHQSRYMSPMMSQQVHVENQQNYEWPHGRPRAKDPPLLILVEKYLERNSDKSFVNLEHMTAELQKQGFRYSRMKKSAFSVLVRKAYNDYCSRHEGTEKASFNSQEEEHSSDSDVVIEDGANNAFLGNQPLSTQSPACSSHMMSNFYQRDPDRFSEVKTPEYNRNQTAPPTFGRAGNGGLVHTTEASDVQNNRSSYSVQGPTNVVVESDDDLEIVEVEVTERSSVHTRAHDKLIEVSADAQNDSPAKNVQAQTQNYCPIRHCSKRKAPSSPNLVEKVLKKPNITDINNPSSNSIESNASVPYTYGRGTSNKMPNHHKFSDFVGNEKVVEDVSRMLLHLKHPELYLTFGVKPPRGFILYGQPGVGKTLLARCIAGELKLPMLQLTATELISGVSGASENNIRDLFKQAESLAPCILFIDEIDSITPRRDVANREMERRIVSQLLASLDELTSSENADKIMVIGATNRLESIDSSLRRAGRFDREISIGVPNLQCREIMLQHMCEGLRIAPGFDYNKLAQLTPGFVGADLKALIGEAAVQAVRGIFDARLYCSDLSSRGERKSDDMVTSFGTEKNLPSDSPLPQVFEMKETENAKKTALGSYSNQHLTCNESKRLESSKKGIKNFQTNKGEQKSRDEQIESEDASIQDLEPMEVDANVRNTKNIDEVSGPVVQDTVEKSKSSQSQRPEVINIDCENEDSDSVILDERCADGIGRATESSKNIRRENKSALSLLRMVEPLSASELQELYIFMDDFERALKVVQPSSKREGFATVPDITWKDVGALEGIKEELQVAILGPIQHAEEFTKLGLTHPGGVLLCGPPGTGKTLVAKAVANEAGINFIAVKGPELMNMYVGESERGVRQVFSRAKISAPCVIFFDEIDSLCPRRSDSVDNGSSSRVVNQILTEMDGMESRTGVFIMAATNRPDIIDPAVLRPGRLDKILYVDFPSADEKVAILNALTKHGTSPLLGEDVDLKSLAYDQRIANFTGADLAALVREASIMKFKEFLKRDKSQVEDVKVYQRHFEHALCHIRPSVSENDRQVYARLKNTYLKNSL